MCSNGRCLECLVWPNRFVELAVVVLHLCWFARWLRHPIMLRCAVARPCDGKLRAWCNLNARTCGNLRVAYWHGTDPVIDRGQGRLRYRGQCQCGRRT